MKLRECALLVSRALSPLEERMVCRLLCVGTVEERILALQEKKSELAKSVLEGYGSLLVLFGFVTLEYY